jgi:hypothetical protein
MLLAVVLAPIAAWGGVGTWTCNGPYGGFFRCIAIDPQHPSTLFAANRNGYLWVPYRNQR